MDSVRKQNIYNLLKGIETGDPESVKVVNEHKYIQHNPQTQEGGEGLAHLFARLAKANPTVEIIRLFEDGDFVFAHTIYDFSGERIGFEIFRYEGDFVVEHWDNIQFRAGDMIGGSIDICDHDLTQANRAHVQSFVEQVFIKSNTERLEEFINFDRYEERSTFMEITDKTKRLDYNINHRLLAEGNFVLSVSEGYHNDAHSSFFDLFRLENGKITEHWDTTEKIPARNTWKNENGKF